MEEIRDGGAIDFGSLVRALVVKKRGSFAPLAGKIVGGRRIMVALPSFRRSRQVGRRPPAFGSGLIRVHLSS